MTFPFACRQCGHDNQAELGWVGRTIPCAGCGENLIVPAPIEPAEGNGGVGLVSSANLRFACPGCGRKYSTKPEMAGKKIRCGGCGAGVRVPGVSAAGAGASSPSRSALREFEGGPARSGVRAPALDRHAGDPVAAAFDLDSLADAAGVRPSPRKTKARSDGGEVVESILPSRTEAIAEVEKALAEKAVVEEEKKRKQAKKKSKRKTRSTGGLEPKEVANIIGLSVLSAVVLGGLAYSSPALRFPIGGLLVAVGGITYVVGILGFSHVAREEGAVYSLCCKFVPLYKWYYLYSRWDMMKGHFTFYVVGLLLLSPGWLIIKESPYSKRLDAIEKGQAVLGRPGVPLQAPPPLGLGSPQAPGDD